MRPEVNHEQSIAGQWPHPVTVVRSVRLSEDLGSIVYRSVNSIRIYNGNDVALALTVERAQLLVDSLSVAIQKAAEGPFGDLEAPVVS